MEKELTDLYRTNFFEIEGVSISIPLPQPDGTLCRPDRGQGDRPVHLLLYEVLQGRSVYECSYSTGADLQLLPIRAAQSLPPRDLWYAHVDYSDVI